MKRNTQIAGVSLLIRPQLARDRARPAIRHEANAREAEQLSSQAELS